MDNDKDIAMARTCSQVKQMTDDRVIHKGKPYFSADTDKDNEYRHRHK